MKPSQILGVLLNMEPLKTQNLPADQRGIYGLVDHTGQIRYIGSTSALKENFRKRIHQRHRTGSESHSHYFSKIYNTGRMYRCRLTQQHDPDAKKAKNLRNLFIAEYCRAVFAPLAGSKAEIEEIERTVISLASPDCIRWNRSTYLEYPEPVELVDALIGAHKFSDVDRAAFERQRSRYLARH